MTKRSVIIVGSNPTGIQAAIGFADLGFHVHLVETSPFLEKGKNSWLQPLELCAQQLKLSHHPNVTLWTNSKATRVRGKPGSLKVELRQHPRYVDLECCTACGDCIEVCPVTLPGLNHKAIYLDGQPGCLAIDKLGVSPCANTCPGGIHVQGYIALIAQRRFQEAIDLIHQAIPFPGICGRVCTHPCEVNCRRNEIDEPVAVRALKRFVADWELSQPSSKTVCQQPSTDIEIGIKNTRAPVAIVGAGPGGMAVANALIRLGYQVTVYDKLPVVGGMMAVGIPRYRLPQEIIEREYQQIINLGIDIKLNTPIGPDGKHTLDDLFKMGYQAICLSVGAHRSQSLGIPGEGLGGVLHGIEVLRKINIDKDTVSFLPHGSKTHLAIIGGGNTAMDVSRSLKRLGVENVRVLYRRSHHEMPAMPEEVEDALQEGIKIDFLVSPQRILGEKETGVSGLECIRMQLGETDASGRRRPVPIAGSEFVLDLDLIILAIGQSPNLEFLDPNHNIAITKDQRINIRDIDFMTSRCGVFAVGDAVTRDKMAIIEAIGMGKRAAAGIDAYLRGISPHIVSVDSRQVPVAHRELSHTERKPLPRIPMPTISLEKRQTTFDEVEKGFTIEQALSEAKRCLACGPCSECQACVQVCQAGAIIHDQEEKTAEIKAGVIIFTEKPTQNASPLESPINASTETISIKEGEGIFYLDTNNPLAGSAVITQALPYLVDSLGTSIFNKEQIYTRMESEEGSLGKSKYSILENKHPRIGLFICQCGQENHGKISKVINTMTIAAIASTWPTVAHVQILPFSCSLEGTQVIENAIQEHTINHVVVAGCTCCSINQICDSCTYQRVRCKDKLHFFSQSIHSNINNSQNALVQFEFVNIREQCAWVHWDDPEAATTKATAMIAGAVASVKFKPVNLLHKQWLTKSTMILGSSPTIRFYIQALEKYGMELQVPQIQPDQVIRNGGYYSIIKKDQSWQTSSLVVVPRDELEASELLTVFQAQTPKPEIICPGQAFSHHQTGAFLVSPGLNPQITAPAVAAKVASWLNHIDTQPQPFSFVDPSRCRACGTCIEICEFGAPEIIQYNGQRTSWIDPAICTGCSICTAHCPSGAITASHSSDLQVDAILSAVLSPPAAYKGE